MLQICHTVYTQTVAINTEKTMRYISIFLFLILVGCKNETKNKSEIRTENQPKMTTETKDGIDKSVSVMWNDFTESNPEFKNNEIPESDFFHNNEKDANRLAELTLTGKRKLRLDFIACTNNIMWTCQLLEQNKS